jgi:transcriptional regulator GlxA family with amidase domain
VGRKLVMFCPFPSHSKPATKIRRRAADRDQPRKCRSALAAASGRDRQPATIDLAPSARSGLPPRALRRVREYIESHVEENIALETLAGIAGFSMFARAFKQSEGVTPHGYLLERRVERAQKLLSGTNLSLSEIALASGFSDQSHLARHFRQRVGVSPSMFRCRSASLIGR